LELLHTFAAKHLPMRIIFLALLALTTPAAALAGPDIPLIAIGLPFAPEAPKPLSPEHPLFGRITFAQIDQLPGSVRFSVAAPGSIHKGLRDTLAQMKMLAPDAPSAKVRLIARWVSVEPSSPFVAKGDASATLAYQLVRIDTGETIFQRTIRTTIKASGSHLDGTMGGRRGAVAVNFASLAFCLDKAALGSAPADCALQPLFGVNLRRF